MESTKCCIFDDNIDHFPCSLLAYDFNVFFRFLGVHFTVMERNNDMKDGEEGLKEAEVTKNVSLHTTELKEKNIILKICR